MAVKAMDLSEVMFHVCSKLANVCERWKFAIAGGTGDGCKPGKVVRPVAPMPGFGGKMYGLIGRMIAAEGRREELMAILKGSAGGRMPGCHSYIVARCNEHPDGIWVTEVWDTPESHKASLDLTAVQDAIAQARPLIAGFDNRFETEPVGGVGL